MVDPSVESLFPLVTELAESVDRTLPGHYFANFEADLASSGARQWYERLEADLGALTEEARLSLVRKCRPYMCTTRGPRGWDQLISTLEERKGYMFLQMLGCDNIRFLPEGNDPTPDIAADSVEGPVALEVRTLQRSDEALRHIYIAGSGKGQPRFRAVPTRYASALGDKFKRTLDEAALQLAGFGGPASRRIAYLILEADHSIHFGPRMTQVQSWIASFRPENVEVVLECRELIFSAWPRIKT